MAGVSLHFSVRVWALSAVQAQAASNSGLAGYILFAMRFSAAEDRFKPFHLG